MEIKKKIFFSHIFPLRPKANLPLSWSCCLFQSFSPLRLLNHNAVTHLQRRRPGISHLLPDTASDASTILKDIVCSFCSFPTPLPKTDDTQDTIDFDFIFKQLRQFSCYSSNRHSRTVAILSVAILHQFQAFKIPVFSYFFFNWRTSIFFSVPFPKPLA